MSIFKEIGKWIRGWHLEYLWQNTPNGDITLEKGTANAAIAIANFRALLNSPEGLGIRALISNEGQDTINKVDAILDESEEKIAEVKTLPDLSGSFKDFQFSDDPKKNAFFHQLFDTVALALNDGKVSVLEGLGIVAIIMGAIKGKVFG